GQQRASVPPDQRATAGIARERSVHVDDRKDDRRRSCSQAGGFPDRGSCRLESCLVAVSKDEAASRRIKVPETFPKACDIVDQNRKLIWVPGPGRGHRTSRHLVAVLGFMPGLYAGGGD